MNNVLFDELATIPPSLFDENTGDMHILSSISTVKSISSINTFRYICDRWKCFSLGGKVAM